MDERDYKAMNEELNQPCGSHFFKKQLVEYFIPRIEAMAELERAHLHFLIDMKAPTDFINRSQETHFHFVGKIKEYKEYAERL
jgi:hypothetical protein